MLEITMPRGDLRPVRFTVTEAEGTLCEAEFTEIYVTVKKSMRHAEYLFQKRLSDGTVARLGPGEYQFTIQPEDTDGLAVTAYDFDIELICGRQLKQTFVGRLTLTGEVTYAENEGA